MGLLEQADPSRRAERRRRWLRRGAAFAAMVAVGMIYRAQHLTHWDSWDYASQAIAGESSALLLGRWWYIAAMRAAYLVGRGLFGLDAGNAHLAMQADPGAVIDGATLDGTPAPCGNRSATHRERIDCLHHAVAGR